MSALSIADTAADKAAARFRPVTVATQRDADGTIRMRANEAMPPYPDRLHDYLPQWAAKTPERILLAERRTGQQGWATIT